MLRIRSYLTRLQLNLGVRWPPISEAIRTMSTQTVDALRQRARRYAWLALALGVLSLVLALVGRLVGGHPLPWTSWAVPVLLIANTGVSLLPQAHQYPRATGVYYRVAIATGLLIFGAILVQL
jgi:hypothetical protein